MFIETYIIVNIYKTQIYKRTFYLIAVYYDDKYLIMKTV